jgi:hypothetical protein
MPMRLLRRIVIYFMWFVIAQWYTHVVYTTLQYTYMIINRTVISW